MKLIKDVGLDYFFSYIWSFFFVLVISMVCFSVSSFYTFEFGIKKKRVRNVNYLSCLSGIISKGLKFLYWNGATKIWL
jgi:hypothetical protein